MLLSLSPMATPHGVCGQTGSDSCASFVPQADGAIMLPEALGEPILVTIDAVHTAPQPLALVNVDLERLVMRATTFWDMDFVQAKPNLSTGP